MKLVIYYSLFAFIAMIVNFLVQELTLTIYLGAYRLWLSIFLGTIAGLIIKFFLDKHYIFKYLVKSHGHNFILFFLYSVMGLITTLIFWGFELSFYYIWGTDVMKYVGGGLGLILGYLSKYFLDKKYVFMSKRGG